MSRCKTSCNTPGTPSRASAKDRGLQGRLAFELFELGEAMKRAQLRREDPEASDAEIEARLVAWLRERPGRTAPDHFSRSCVPTGRRT